MRKYLQVEFAHCSEGGLDYKQRKNKNAKRKEFSYKAEIEKVTNHAMDDLAEI